MYIYSQSSGDFSKNVPSADSLTTFIAKGYSGYQIGKNNPKMENVEGVGPIPRGIYYIGDAYDHPKLGKFTMNLVAQPGTEEFGRSAFRIHGDSVENPGEASHGCIILPRPIREQINNDHDRILNVIA